MRSLVCAFFALLLGFLPLQAPAAPHVLAQLGTAPLVSPIHSTAQLQADVAVRRRLYSIAAAKLGLSPAEYAQFVLRVRTGRMAYVTIPRHLDAMTGAPGGIVEVMDDVVIPANTRGWEVDLTESHDVLAIFVPAKCGNMSVLRRALPAVAYAAAPRKRVRVAAAPTPRFTPQIAAAPSPAPTPAPYESVAATSGPVHHVRLWPLLLVPLIAGLVEHGAHGAGPGLPGPIGGGWGPRAPEPTPAPGCSP